MSPLAWIYLGLAFVAFVIDAWKCQSLWPEQVDWTIVPAMLLLFVTMATFNLLWPLRVLGWWIGRTQRRP